MALAGLCFSFCFAQPQKIDNSNPEETVFKWPQGKKMAISLTFDDGRYSQVDNCIPVLDKYKVKGTFYLSTIRMMQRTDEWKNAISNGHDIGNHTLLHACSGNFDWSRHKALENYTLPQMRFEIDSANREIERALGVRPLSFAYPCGQNYIGRGLNTKSYVPLIASMFETGRTYMDESPNDPAFCDLAQLTGIKMDGVSLDEIMQLINSEKNNGKWLILVNHETGNPNTPGSLTTLETVEAICQFAANPANGIWIDHVQNIATYVRKQRSEDSFSEVFPYRNPLLPVEQRVEDLLGRMTLKEKIGQINTPCAYLERLEDSLSMDFGEGVEEFEYGEVVSQPHKPQKAIDLNKRMMACKKLAEGTLTTIGPIGGFFTMANVMFQVEPRRQAELFNEFQKIAIERTRLKIPLLQTEEGTHGTMCSGTTIFPEGLSLGSTWNKALIEEVYATAAEEARSIGIHQLFTLVIEPNRDPRMGRNEEAYSEDTYMTSRIAEAIVRGCQGYDVSAPDKVVAGLCHFPGQSEAVSGREKGAMEMSERVFRSVFLPPWEAGIKAGALGVMATHPAIDAFEGLPTAGSRKLLTGVLREEFGFEGLVLGEGNSIGTILWKNVASTQKEAAVLALNAGLDVALSFETGYMSDMFANIQDGSVSTGTLDRAVERILTQKFRLGLFENPYVDPERAQKILHSAEHQDFALQAAREGIVLLKNENDLLPLSKNIRSIAVIGPNADDERNQLGDYTPRKITHDIITVLEGIKNKVSPGTRVDYVKGCDIITTDLNEIEKARKAAKKADFAVVVVGESILTNGESKNVASLDLTGMQEELIKAVYSTGTPTIVVLINGRPLSIRWTAENIPTIVEAWNCGEKGGDAVADVLFGDYNPDGHLAITFPRHSGQLPVYYNHKPSKERLMSSGYVDMSAYPLYEFGHGLSYTSFAYSNLTINPETTGVAGNIEVGVDVKNTGKREGGEVVQLYLNDVISSVETPYIELRGYEKIHLNPGETKTVKFLLTPEDLSFINADMKRVVEPGSFEVFIGGSSRDIKLKGSFELLNTAMEIPRYQGQIW